MNIVIDIPKEFETHFEHDKFSDTFARIEYDLKLHRTLTGLYERETIIMLRKAFDDATKLSEYGGKNNAGN